MPKTNEPRVFPMFTHEHGDKRCRFYVNVEGYPGMAVSGTVSRGTAKNLIRRLQDFYDDSEVFEKELKDD